jgi:predicted TIM-barrel fold metal-dependent hydrolase
MEIKFGLISADSHALLDRNAYTERMSQTKWGDMVPHLVELEDKGRTVDRWLVHGTPQDPRGFNCPAAMDNNPLRNLFPQTWEEMPRRAYDPLERLEALDADGVDAEVLFPDKTFYQFRDAAFELDADRATNDALAEWHALSERYIPLAQIPLLGDIDAAVAEVQRCAALGHRGINMLSEPSSVVKGLKHVADPYWDPLWDVCQELEMPIHIHASGGLAMEHSVPTWSGFAPHQNHASFLTSAQIWPTQLIPLLVFGGVLDRFPRLKWVLAEAGVGPVYYALEACDHEWERRRLWTEGLTTRPSEIARRQVFANFWFEVAAIAQRERLGADRIMWESDYPHIVSTYPESWRYAEASMAGVPEDERKQMLYQNALQLYRL